MCVSVLPLRLLLEISVCTKTLSNALYCPIYLVSFDLIQAFLFFFLSESGLWKTGPLFIGNSGKRLMYCERNRPEITVPVDWA